jgi:tRNA pseudouridine13 synthase
LNSDSLPYPYGSPAIGGRIKSRAEDFRVDEELGFEPSGEGEHLLLQVEKRGLSTPELVSRLSSDYGLHPRLIGFSGLKDKNALTTQWLSLHLPGKQEPEARRPPDGYRVLRASRHRAKLRRGTHKSNLFRIRIREVTDLPETTLQQLTGLAGHGMANYFGAQRFGRRGDNVEQALERLAKPRLKRQQKSLLISALRSELFNQVLAERIRMDFWRRPLDGDVFMLRGSHSIFSELPDAALMQRFDSLDISSTASLYGTGRSLLGGDALALERRVRAANPEIVACLEREQSSLQMRPLRVAVEALEYRLDSREGVLELQARLPAGSYLTSLLGHFMTEIGEDQADLR